MLAPRLKGFLRSGRAVLWRRRLTRLAEYGTAGYPAPIRRRLRIMNVAAYLIAAFNLFYALEQVILDYADLEAGHLHQSGADGRRTGGAVPAPFQRRRRGIDPGRVREHRPVRAHLHPGHRVRPAHTAFRRRRRLFRRPGPRAVEADPGPHRRRPGAAPRRPGPGSRRRAPCCTRGPTSWTTSTSRRW